MQIGSAKTIPVIEQTLRVPHVWTGLQAWFDASYGFTNDQFSGSYSNPQYRNNWYSLLADSAGREFQKDYVGNVYNGLLRVNLNGSNSGFPTPTETINGLTAMTAPSRGTVHYLSGESYSDSTDKTRQNTRAYTIFLVFKVPSGAVGGIISQADSLIATNDAAGFRVGLSTSGNEVIVQHNSGNRLSISRDVRDDTPVIMSIRCSESQAINCMLWHGGSLTTHSQQFYDQGFNAASSLVIGNCHDVGTGAKSWSIFGKYNKDIGEVNTNYIISMLMQRFS